MSKPTLQEIAMKIGEADVHCRWCKTRIKAINIESYDHTGGIELEGYEKPQWVYFTCEGCNYQWSLWKLLRQIEARQK